MSERLVGLTPHNATAAEQLQAVGFSHVGVQPLPQPYKAARVTAEQVGIKDSDSITFFVIGDHGGVKAPGPQNAVSYAMQRSKAHASFVSSVGDIVYFNGDASEYAPQFYEPYGSLALPFVAIPGNHDGDTTDDPSRAPLDTFMANWCAGSPSAPPADPHLEYRRHTQTLPSHDWCLELKAVTIIGLYSNVASGGHLEPEQVAFLTDSLKAAPKDRPLIVELHHPPYSVDAHHGGAKHMGDLIDQAVVASGSRGPDLVLAGHVHDYQRFTRRGLRAGSNQTATYIVIGNSGYHNLHQLAKDATPGMDLGNGVTFEKGDAKNYGFLTITAKGGKLSGTYTAVKPGTMPDGSDATVTERADTF